MALPSIDFSLPAADDATRQTATSELPGLPPPVDLPTFPEPLTAAAGGPSTGPANEPTAATAGPPPPRRRSPPPLRASRLPAGLDLDNLPLPDLSPPVTKRGLTLVGVEAAALLAASLQEPPRRRWPWVTLALLVSLGIGALLGRDRIMTALAPTHLAVPLSAAERAREQFAHGVDAFNNKAYDQALMAFQRTLELDPSFAQVHRSLGILFATLKTEEKAVEHYRRYLELEPQAPDAVAVRKIIDDFAATRAKPAAPVVAAPVVAAPGAGVPAAAAGRQPPPPARPAIAPPSHGRPAKRPRGRVHRGH